MRLQFVSPSFRSILKRIIRYGFLWLTYPYYLNYATVIIVCLPDLQQSNMQVFG